MSRETRLHLNTFILRGYTETYGNAWHRDDALQAAHGLESNHYAGAIPVEDVLRRLFNPLVLIEGNVESTYTLPSPLITDDGVQTTGTIVAPDRKTVVRAPGSMGKDDQGEILGIFKLGWAKHDYAEWLIQNADRLAGGGLGIGSAGLLEGGGVAFVQAHLDEDSITTPEGITFRPFLNALSSVNGTKATTYFAGGQVIECDNTMDFAIATDDYKNTKVKVKHTKYSQLKIGTARESLDILFKVSEDFKAGIAALNAQAVSDKAWSAFLDTIAPDTDDKGVRKTGAALTFATTKRDALSTLWNNDNRVSPWKNTALGVVQAVNTYEHWNAIIRGGDRQARNMNKMVAGDWGTLDSDTLTTLNKVLATV